MKILSRLFEARKDEPETFINDRRCAKRHGILLRLNYRDPVTNFQGESLTRNISRTGLRFPVETRIAKGAILDIKIEDPNGNASLSSKAKVIWLEEFITGDDADDVIYEVGVKLLKKRLY